MSKPSSKSRRRYTAPQPPLSHSDPIAAELRKMLHDLLIGVRQWGLKLESMTRQKYDPDSMVEAFANFLQLYEFFAQVVQKAAKIPHANPAQKELANAAAILLFYQGPMFEGCTQGIAAGATLDSFLDTVHAVMDANEEEPPHGDEDTKEI